MEKLSLISNGIVKLPPGFRFHPTDQELVLQYLKRKALSCPLPASIIPEFDVCRADPWDLPGDKRQERYFFSTREAKYPNGNRSNRATLSGYWKATGKDKPILLSSCRMLSNASSANQVVGMKKTLVFYRGKPPHGSRTDWIMHEYRLPQGFAQEQSSAEDWVLCRIFLKKRSSKNNTQEEEEEEEECKEEERNVVGATVVAEIHNKAKPVYYDFIMTKDRAKPRMTTDLNVVPSSLSSGSSGVTDEDAADGLKLSPEETEESSSCNSLATFMRKP